MNTVHCSNTLGASTCTNTATAVILVRTWMEDCTVTFMPKYWPVFTCEDCAPEVMHELLAMGESREDMITAVIDTPAVTYELVTWQYDEGTYVRFPTTQSYKPAGTVKVGDRLPDAPHMQAIAVTASTWTPAVTS